MMHVGLHTRRFRARLCRKLISHESKKNMDGRSTSSHDKKSRTRSMEKQRGMAFGFRETVTAVKKPDRLDR